MRRSTGLIVMFAFACFFAPMLVAQNFEGVIVSKTTVVRSATAGPMDMMKNLMKNMPQDQKEAAEKMMADMPSQGSGGPSEREEFMQTIYLKNGKMCIESEAEDAPEILIDFNSGIVRNVMHDKKAYMEMNIDELSEQMKSIQSKMQQAGLQTDEGQQAEIKKTGKKQKINGFTCEQYVRDEGDETSEYWMTKDVTFQDLFGSDSKYMKTVEKMMSMDKMAGKGYYDLGGYPVLIIEKDPHSTTTTETMKIEKTKVADSKYKVPENYKKMTMSEMMGF
ncbi:hypothetical protein A2V82_02180 [candidate division KSB1 bacterium RBG_16_48_16]|nr:MAG: hypothetical protein A2V82_02180 [candidate division KSB1 bacterium RBG_16_48_16]